MRRRIGGLIVAAALLAWTGLVQALSAVERSFDELVSLADVIIIGTVASKESYWNNPDQQDRIYTRVTLADLDVLKGRVASTTYEIRLRGGQIGPYGEQFVGLPQLREGSRYVLFVKDNFRAVFPLVGIDKGILEVRLSPEGEPYVIAVDGSPVTSIADIEAPSSGKSLTGTGAPLTVERLRREIEGRLSD